LAKYYLYNHKLNQIEPEVNEFKRKLTCNFKYQVEKFIEQFRLVKSFYKLGFIS